MEKLVNTINDEVFNGNMDQAQKEKMTKHIAGYALDAMHDRSVADEAWKLVEKKD